VIIAIQITQDRISLIILFIFMCLYLFFLKGHMRFAINHVPLARNFLASSFHKVKILVESTNSCDISHKSKYMENKAINKIIGKTDIYLVDQIVKGRYRSSETILDAGCGSGRNLHWFYHNNFEIFGIDQNEPQIEDMKKKYFKQKDHFSISSLESMNFENEFFNHIICNAVLHFAKDKAHFIMMFSELFRVLKPKGSLFIRVASDIGLENKIIPVSEGVFQLPDGTTRFLLTKSLFLELQNEHKFTMLETFKTVNVNDLRAMTTLVLQKKIIYGKI